MAILPWTFFFFLFLQLIVISGQCCCACVDTTEPGYVGGISALFAFPSGFFFSVVKRKLGQGDREKEFLLFACVYRVDKSELMCVCARDEKNWFNSIDSFFFSPSAATHPIKIDKNSTRATFVTTHKKMWDGCDRAEQKPIKTNLIASHLILKKSNTKLSD